MKEQSIIENETSPIDGLNNKQFEKIRDQIVEYMKMYTPDGEMIGAYKIMKLFEPPRKEDLNKFAVIAKASFMDVRKKNL